MVNILGLVIATIVVMGLGGAGGYLIWIFTRPKKQTWSARVYQLGDGVREPIIDKKGKVISTLKLNDLKPYAIDVIEKINKAPGITIYRLQKLNKTTPSITADVVDYWGEKRKEVAVLLLKDSTTLLKKGYDKFTGEAIFRPLSYDRVNMMKSEMAIRKDRLQKQKDILQAITPWIVAGITILGLVAITYVLVQGYIEIVEKSNEAVKYSADKLLEVERMRQGTLPSQSSLGKQEESEPPPFIEGG